MSDQSKGLSVPKWDGKEESCPRYLAKLKALAEYYNCGDALDEGIMMSECPDESEFKSLQTQSVLSNDKKKKSCCINKTNACVQLLPWVKTVIMVSPQSVEQL